MASIREFSRRLLGRLALPQPTGTRTLNVLVTDAQVPAFGHRCLCSIAAWYAWRAAHEQGCSTIRVHNGPTHKHSFDTVDLYRKVLGPAWVPSVFRVRGRTPRFLATRGHQALGNVFDTTRPTFRVAETITAVSSADAGGKELINA
mgnify:FL=1